MHGQCVMEDVLMEGFLLDLHIHTAESSYCGKVPAREIVRAYRDAGFHGVAVTDHYSAYFFDKIKEICIIRGQIY